MHAGIGVVCRVGRVSYRAPTESPTRPPRPGAATREITQGDLHWWDFGQGNMAVLGVTLVPHAVTLVPHAVTALVFCLPFDSVLKVEGGGGSRVVFYYVDFFFYRKLSFTLSESCAVTFLFSFSLIPTLALHPPPPILISLTHPSSFHLSHYDRNYSTSIKCSDVIQSNYYVTLPLFFPPTIFFIFSQSFPLHSVSLKHFLLNFLYPSFSL